MRQFSVELAVNPNTVARAYLDLEVEGVIYKRQGAGTFVSSQGVEMSKGDLSALPGHFQQIRSSGKVMKKLFAFALLLALAAAFAAQAALDDDPAPGDNPAPGNNPAIGAAAPDFTLPDADGKEHSLASLKGSKGTVIIFVATQCPVSNAYNERMQKLAEEYKAKGVNVVGINSNVGEPAAEVKSHAAEKGLTFAILKDPNNKVADRFNAQVTPEAYLLDASGKLVYRGRIDNARYGYAITAAELRDAIEATLAGKPVEKSEVKAFGCSIKRAS